MSIRQQLELLLLLAITLGTVTDAVWAQQELREADHNRLVLELPSINFTRIYNEVPLINLGRLYSRLFNTTKEKPVEMTAVKPEEAVGQRQEPTAQPVVVLPYPVNGFYDPASEIQRSNQVLNIQIPNQPNGQQLFGGFGYAYGPGSGSGPGPGPVPAHAHVHAYGHADEHGSGSGYGYGYGYPDYSQIYGSSNYNSLPGVQVLPQPSYSSNAGFGASNFYNYVNLNNEAIRRGYRRRGYELHNADFNDGRSQLYADFAPYRQWLQRQSQQLNAQQQQLAYEDYDEEQEDCLGLANEFDEADDYGVDEYADIDEADYGDGDDLWRQSDAGYKSKTKTKTKFQPDRKLKSRRKKQRLAKHRSKRIIY